MIPDILHQIHIDSLFFHAVAITFSLNDKNENMVFLLHFFWMISALKWSHVDHDLAHEKKTLYWYF